MSEFLLGFDIRRVQIVPDYHTHVETEGRTSLMKEHLKLEPRSNPFTIDTLISHSLFQEDGVLGALELLPKKSFMHECLDLWEDIERLRTAFASIRAILPPSALESIVEIAVSIDLGSIEREKEYWEPLIGATVLPRVPDNFYRFGFDVADSYMLSAVSNIFFHRTKTFPDRWVTHLNQFSLFDRMSDALDFQTFAERTNKEHSPFFVYGLYGVP